MAQREPGLAPEREQSSATRSSTSILPILPVLSVLAVATGLFYSLGLIILAVRIYECVHNFSATWYAATLVSNKVVLGQSIRVFSPRRLFRR
jgi:hypothetical protein